MLLRLLAVPGRLAHLVNLIFLDRRQAQKQSANPRAGYSRPAFCVAIGVAAIGIAVFASYLGFEGSVNEKPTDYTVSQLVANPNVGTKVYARVTGTMHEWYVEQTKNDKFDKAWYLIGETNGDAWIIVESRRSEDEINKIVADDGTVTFTGMLRTDNGEITEAIKQLGTDVPSVNISHALLLKEGQTPANPLVMFTIAGVATTLALFMIIGWGIGYQVFRASSRRNTAITTGFSGAMPVRVTGLIPGYTGGKRTLNMKASLQVPVPDPDAPAPAMPVDLVWISDQGATGIRLTPGTTSAALGTAHPLSGEMPAIRIAFLKFKLTLAFDSELARDTAFDQLRLSAGLTPDSFGATAKA